MGAAKIPAIVVLLLSFFILPRSVQAKYSGGTGGPDDPYLISTAEDMNQIGRNYTDWDKCFKLTADINLSAYTGTQFSRIGPDDKHAFSGVFDGNGRTISGFTYTTENSSYIGVFGNISTAGRVENVSLVDVNVTGYHYVGGLVGHNDGTISNCNSTGSVSGYQYVGGLVGYNGGTISNCSSTGSVGTSNSYEVGGLVGHNDGTISNCNSTGSVSGYQYVGGLVGDNYGNTISNCYSTGAVTGGSDSDYLGGLVGYVNYSYVTDCYAAGEVAGDYDAGGLVGVNDNSTITRCYSSGSVSAYMYVGGLLGWNYSGTTADSFWDTNTSGQSWSAGGTGKTTVEMKTKSTFTDAGWNFFTTWDIVEGQTYPFFKSGGGTGTPDDPYRIATAEDLLAMAADTSYYDKCFILTADIDMEGQAFMTAIIASGDVFTGTFDGNGHKITNFTINGGDNLGLFGWIGGSVKNLGLENFSVSGSSGSEHIGGLVGYNVGSIRNCYSTGSVSGYQYVGGLVGDSYGNTISNCYSTGAVSGGYDSDYLGGLVGYVYYGYVMDCYAAGEVAGDYDAGGLVGVNDNSTITRCYSSGSVSGYMYVGGLLGWNYSGTTADSFWDTNTSGQSWSAGGTGKTTVEMKTKSTFTDAGWNFFTTWDIVEGQTYPFFKSGGGTGTPDDPYQIATKADLLAMAAGTSYYDKCFILTADIDMEGQAFMTAIIASGDVFTGTFDGNGHKITNFTINGGDNLGLFGWIGGSVKNLGLENFSVSGSSGSEHIGGLVGYNGGTISNCSSTGSVSGSSGSVYIGGLVGYNDGTISNCNSTGAVSGSWEKLGGLVGYNVGIISSCYSTGAVSGSSYYVGGLVGWNVGIISNCYATGTVSGYNALGGLVGENYNGNKNDNGSISNCYSTGTVSGFFDSAIVGGLVGNNSGSISHSYFLVTSGPDNGFGTPLTNAQMKQRVSLVGWDFNALWHICETTNYPKLIWQMLPADFVCPDGVNFADFGFFANWWGAENCAGANNCDGADFDFSGKVDEADLAIMCDYWLKGL